MKITWVIVASLPLVTATAYSQAPAEATSTSHADAPPAPSLLTPRLALVRRGASPLLRRWERAARADLELVDDVRLVRRGATHELVASIEGGELVVTLGDTARRYPLTPDGLPRAAHRSVDDALEALTSRRGSFESTLVFVRRVRGHKVVFRSGPTGDALSQVSRGGRSAMLPALAHGDIWFSVLHDGALFLTREQLDEAPVLHGGGLVMGVRPCGERIVFSSTATGDAEIWSASASGEDLRRLTFDPGIDISPACGPAGEVVFVSNRSGLPRLHALDPAALERAAGERGETEPRLLPQPEGANQTPVRCGDRLAFTHVERNHQSVWVRDGADGTARQVSPRGRRHADPAFSPDCRALAYDGEDGLWVARLDGSRRRRVVTGRVDTVRWGPSPEGVDEGRRGLPGEDHQRQQPEHEQERHDPVGLVLRREAPDVPEQLAGVP